MEIRCTRPEDLPGLHRIFTAAIGELYRRHAFEPPAPPEQGFVAQQSHLLRHDGDRCCVAEADGRIVGYAAAFAREDSWFLSSLFVLPGLQAAGVGTALLARVWGEGFGRRLTLTDAIQPISNALYARRGLIPTTPVLALLGESRQDGVSEVLEPSAPEPEALAGLDRAAYGFERGLDHAYWCRQAEATLWRRQGAPVAYSYAAPHGRIGPVAGQDGASAAAALESELVRRRGQRCAVVVPGTSASLLSAALAAGLRLAAPPGLLLLSQPESPPRALALSSYTLF
ncbi:MAG: GNAT family N-acetyltransferase [Actinobacteria bacterium]|nr:GNAT family N-acetyltransferase [Actinomycetota bacterium]